MTETPHAVQAHGLVKTFGDLRAVDGIDLEVSQGEILGVLGPNGAGKTTMLKMLATLLPIDAGQARIFGVSTWPARPTASASSSASPGSTPPSTRTSPPRRTCGCSGASRGCAPPTPASVA